MQKSYNGVALPQGGEAIQYVNGKYQVPDHPIIPYIEGDGTGRDIWRASQRVFDAAVAEGLRRQTQRSPGSKSSPAKRRISNSRTGCRMIR